MAGIVLWIAPGTPAKVGSQDFRTSVGLSIVCEPIRCRSADRCRLEPIRLREDRTREITAVTPSHNSEAVRVRDTFSNQMVDARHHIVVVADSLRVGILQTKGCPIVRRSSKVRREDCDSMLKKNLNRIHTRCREAVQ